MRRDSDQLSNLLARRSPGRFRFFQAWATLVPEAGATEPPIHSRRVRRAEPADAAAIAALASELGYPTGVDAMRSRLESCARSEGDVVFAAVDSAERVVGWAHCQRQQTLTSEPFALLTGLVVAGHARRRGVGQALVHAVAAFAAHEQLGTLRVRTRTSREDARAFYERLGFGPVKTQAVLECSLSGRGREESRT